MRAYKFFGSHVGILRDGEMEFLGGLEIEFPVLDEIKIPPVTDIVRDTAIIDLMKIKQKYCTSRIWIFLWFSNISAAPV
jgi:hypothetical protein